jgi:hypothetical protein
MNIRECDSLFFFEWLIRALSLYVSSILKTLLHYAKWVVVPFLREHQPRVEMVPYFPCMANTRDAVEPLVSPHLFHHLAELDYYDVLFERKN